MPYRFLNIKGVADYLHLELKDVLARVKNQEIPYERRGDKIVFSKAEVNLWASQRILNFSELRPAPFRSATVVVQNDFPPLLSDLLEQGSIASAMTAKTKSSVLHELVAMADRTGHVCDPKQLLASVEARENLNPTAVPGGWAFPHPGIQDPYLLDASFIVVGRTIQEIHFGSPDGLPTTLFFLICCRDEAVHLPALGRVCALAQKTDLGERLRSAPDSAAMAACIATAETNLKLLN